MANAEVAYLLERVTDVRSRVAARGDRRLAWIDEDVEEVVLEAAEFLRRALDVPELEAQLVTRSQIDRDALDEVVRALEAVAAEDPGQFELKLPDGTELAWRDRLESLRNLVDSLGQPESLEEIEVGLRLSLVGDAALEKLMIALAADHSVRALVQERLTAKLTLLGDQEALDYWARLRAEVDPSRESHLPTDTTIAERAFFDLGDAGTVRPRIAAYLARVRPLLIREALLRGQTRVPAGQAGLAVILSWTSHPSTKAWSTRQRIAIRSLGRIALAWSGDKDELAQALGVSSDGFFIGGRAEQEAKRALGRRESQGPDETDLLAEVVKLLKIAEREVGTPDSPVERALRAYKLGLEVVAGDIQASHSKLNELRLQRELCRFLVERHIPAYGTQFGWSEVDLRTEDALGAVLIEAKKITKVPSEADINRWLTQLGSYLDQEHRALRGVLAIYNFSPAPILAPATAIRLKYLVIAVNLCPTSPSKRRAAIEIVEGRDGNVVDVVRIGDPKRTVRMRRTQRSPRTRR